MGFQGQHTFIPSNRPRRQAEHHACDHSRISAANRKISCARERACACECVPRCKVKAHTKCSYAPTSRTVPWEAVAVVVGRGGGRRGTSSSPIASTPNASESSKVGALGFLSAGLVPAPWGEVCTATVPAPPPAATPPPTGAPTESTGGTHDHDDACSHHVSLSHTCPHPNSFMA